MGTQILDVIVQSIQSTSPNFPILSRSSLLIDPLNDLYTNRIYPSSNHIVNVNDIELKLSSISHSFNSSPNISDVQANIICTLPTVSCLELSVGDGGPCINIDRKNDSISFNHTSLVEQLPIITFDSSSTNVVSGTLFVGDQSKLLTTTIGDNELLEVFVGEPLNSNIYVCNITNEIGSVGIMGNSLRIRSNSQYEKFATQKPDLFQFEGETYSSNENTSIKIHNAMLFNGSSYITATFNINENDVQLNTTFEADRSTSVLHWTSQQPAILLDVSSSLIIIPTCTRGLVSDTFIASASMNHWDSSARKINPLWNTGSISYQNNWYSAISPYTSETLASLYANIQNDVSHSENILDRSLGGIIIYTENTPLCHQSSTSLDEDFVNDPLIIFHTSSVTSSLGRHVEIPFYPLRINNLDISTEIFFPNEIYDSDDNQQLRTNGNMFRILMNGANAGNIQETTGELVISAFRTFTKTCSALNPVYNGQNNETIDTTAFVQTVALDVLSNASNGNVIVNVANVIELQRSQNVMIGDLSLNACFWRVPIPNFRGTLTKNGDGEFEYGEISTGLGTPASPATVLFLGQQGNFALYETNTSNELSAITKWRYASQTLSGNGNKNILVEIGNQYDSKGTIMCDMLLGQGPIAPWHADYSNAILNDESLLENYEGIGFTKELFGNLKVGDFRIGMLDTSSIIQGLAHPSTMTSVLGLTTIDSVNCAVPHTIFQSENSPYILFRSCQDTSNEENILTETQSLLRLGPSGMYACDWGQQWHTQRIGALDPSIDAYVFGKYARTMTNSVYAGIVQNAYGQSALPGTFSSFVMRDRIMGDTDYVISLQNDCQMAISIAGSTYPYQIRFGEQTDINTNVIVNPVRTLFCTSLKSTPTNNNGNIDIGAFCISGNSIKINEVASNTYSEICIGSNEVVKISDAITNINSLTTDISGNLVVRGNFSVIGEQTSVQSSTTVINDKDLQLATNSIIDASGVSVQVIDGSGSTEEYVSGAGVFLIGANYDEKSLRYFPESSFDDEIVINNPLKGRWVLSHDLKIGSDNGNIYVNTIYPANATPNASGLNVSDTIQTISTIEQRLQATTTLAKLSLPMSLVTLLEAVIDENIIPTNNYVMLSPMEQFHNSVISHSLDLTYAGVNEGGDWPLLPSPHYAYIHTNTGLLGTVGKIKVQISGSNDWFGTSESANQMNGGIEVFVVQVRADNGQIVQTNTIAIAQCTTQFVVGGETHRIYEDQTTSIPLQLSFGIVAVFIGIRGVQTIDEENPLFVSPARIGKVSAQVSIS